MISKQLMPTLSEAAFLGCIFFTQLLQSIVVTYPRYLKKKWHVCKKDEPCKFRCSEWGDPSKILDVKDQHMLTELFTILTVGFSKYHYSAPLFYSAYYPITLKITTDSIKYFPKQVLFQLFKIPLKTIQVQLSALKQKNVFQKCFSWQYENDVPPKGIQPFSRWCLVKTQQEGQHM